MTTYEKCKAIRQFIVNRAAEVMNYQWSDDFSTKQIREIYEVAKQDGISELNISELTSSQMDDLGFGKWSKDNPMRLIPLWLYQWLPDQIETECIDGKKSYLSKSSIDTDNRGGCLAYGIYPSDGPKKLTLNK